MVVNHRAGFAALALAAAVAALGGWAFGEWLRLNPCHLCIFQRLLACLLLVIAVFGLLLPMARRLWAALAALTAAGGLTTALYQSWLQLNPDPANECGFGERTAIEQLVDWFGMRWPDFFLATGFCSSKEWVFLGLSIANWACFFFAGVLALALWLFYKKHQEGTA
ncbi:disulfide bond formation protein B [Rhodocyclus purpureus]|uniref:disulfide bond formation protein B n=1 Tax=Rhodocyclus purpureus TaxID=1067 RepID=UPI0019133E56|nr:disulfide bond formation protein B [Rhodocyclus purpureus]MBK5912939.1 hypothetical protein [Rhodocyclus purpureus]